MIRKLLLIVCAPLMVTFSINVMATEVGITDKLLTRLLNQQLQAPLLKVDDLPWPAGTYGISISRMGDAKLTSGANSIEIAIPLQTKIAGNINQDLGFTKVALNCQSQFDHMGQLHLTPTFSSGKVTFVSDLKLPIPPVDADCGGVTFPVQEALLQLVAANKLQWESEINQALMKQFNQQSKQQAPN